MDVTKEQKLKIKFIKSPQFTNEFENLKERKINIYKAIHKTIKKIVEIDTETHNQFFDWLIIVGLPPTKRGNPPLRNKYSKNS